MTNKEMIINRVFKFYLEYIPKVIEKEDSTYFKNWVMTKGNNIISKIINNLNEEFTISQMDDADNIIGYYEYLIETSEDSKENYLNYIYEYPNNIYRDFVEFKFLNIKER